MSFIDGIPLEQATGAVREAYDADLKVLGYVANYTKGRAAFSARS